MVTTTLFFLGATNPPQSITLEGAHDFSSGNETGSVSAASPAHSAHIGKQYSRNGATISWISHNIDVVFRHTWPGRCFRIALVGRGSTLFGRATGKLTHYPLHDALDQERVELATIQFCYFRLCGDQLELSREQRIFNTAPDVHNRSYEGDTGHGTNTRLQTLWEQDIGAGVPEFPITPATPGRRRGCRSSQARH